MSATSAATEAHSVETGAKAPPVSVEDASSEAHSPPGGAPAAWFGEAPRASRLAEAASVRRASAERRYLDVLALIDRSYLPRRIVLDNGVEALELYVSGRRLLAAPRRKESCPGGWSLRRGATAPAGAQGRTRPPAGVLRRFLTRVFAEAAVAFEHAAPRIMAPKRAAPGIVVPRSAAPGGAAADVARRTMLLASNIEALWTLCSGGGEIRRAVGRAPAEEFARIPAFTADELLAGAPGLKPARAHRPTAPEPVAPALSAPEPERDLKADAVAPPPVPA